MQLVVKSAGFVQTFRVSVQPHDDVITLTSAVAKRASLKPNLIRLSHAGRLLESRFTMQMLGLAEGDNLQLHVKVGHQPAGSDITPTNDGFGADNIGYFIHVVTASGRAFFRPKVNPSDDVGQILDAAVSRARSMGLGQSRAKAAGSAYPQLRFRGRVLKRGKTVEWYSIAAGDELVLHLENPKPERLRRTSRDGS